MIKRIKNGGSFMYFIDREKMETILKFMEEQFHLLDHALASLTLTPIEKRGIERIFHVIIESFLDVGNGMIDGFIMRDPGSYEDIVEILVDESVLSEDEKTAYLKLISLRKGLVQNYAVLALEELIEPFNAYAKVWRMFPTKVRNYLMSELGPVSAFKPEK